LDTELENTNLDFYVYDVTEDGNIVAGLLTYTYEKYGTTYVISSRSLSISATNVSETTDPAYIPTYGSLTAKISFNYNDVGPKYATINEFAEVLALTIDQKSKLTVGGISEVFQWKDGNNDHKFTLASATDKVYNGSLPVWKHVDVSKVDVLPANLQSESCGTDCVVNILEMAMTTDAGEKHIVRCYVVPTSHKTIKASLPGGYRITFLDMKCDMRLENMATPAAGYAHSLYQFATYDPVNVGSAFADNVNMYFSGGKKFLWNATAILDDANVVSVYNTRMHESDESAFGSHMSANAARAFRRMTDASSRAARATEDMVLHFVTFDTTPAASVDWTFKIEHTEPVVDPWKQGTEASSASTLFMFSCFVFVMSLLLSWNC
jgi:hypothetical protein